MDDQTQVVTESRHRDGAYAWSVAVIMALCLAFSNMDRAVLSLLIVPIEHQFGVNDTTLSLIQGTAFSLFYAAFGLALSRAADNSNRRNLILIGVVIWCTATIGCGLSNSPATLFAARVMVALGEAVLMPAGVSLLADYFTQRYRSRALTTYSMGTHLGGPMSLWVGGVILHKVGAKGIHLPALGHLEGWRVVFLLVGAAGFILVPLLLWVREPARLDEQGRGVASKMSFSEAIKFFKRNRVALTLTILGFALISVAIQSIQAWTPTLFVRLHHWATSAAGRIRIGILAGILGPLGAITGGILSDAFTNRGHHSGKLIVSALAAVIAAVAVILLTLPSDQAAVTGVAVMFFVVAAALGIAQAAIAQLLPNRARGLGASLFIATSNILVALSGPLAIGVMTDHVFHDPLALPMSMRIVAVTLFLAACVILFVGLRPYREGIARQTSDI